MIVKNEEENIINCLERALKVVDEAIVVDTGSTDKTKELLEEKYGNDARVKILEEKWENDFSKARNKSLEYATGDWILILDADERIFCDRGQLEALLRNSNQPAYNIPIYNIYGKDNFTVSTSMIRLYKNNNPKYRGAIHEQLEIDGRGYLGEIIDKDICKIYHYGYSPSVFQKKNKSKRNMDIINEEIKRNPKEPFNWYNKGVMEMIGGNFNKALDDFIKAHKLYNNIRRSFHNDLLIRMIQCLMMLNSYKQAARFIEDISKDVVMKDMPDIYYYLGVCYTKLKKYDAAIKNFQKAVNIGEYYNGISKFGVGSFLSMIEWAKVLELKGEKQLAIEKYKEAVFNENNVGKQGLDDLKRLLKEEDMIDKLNQLEKMLSNNNTASSNATSTENSTIKNDEFERYKKEVKESIQTLIENGMIAEAKESIKEYESIVKNDTDIYSIKGVIAMMEGRLDDAEKLLKEGMYIDEANFDILYNLAYLYMLEGEKSKAYVYYSKAHEVAEDGNLKDEITKTLDQLKNECGFDEDSYGDEEFGQGNGEKDPDNMMDEYRREVKSSIQSLIEQGFLQEAKTLISEYEDIVKDDAEIYSIRGVIAMMEGDMEAAEEILQAGLAVDEENFDLLYNLGYLYQSKQLNDKAIEFYQKAMQNANDESTANSLHEILKSLGVQGSKDSLARKTLPKTSIIILTYNNLDANKICLESIRKYTEKGTYEIIVVDNHSTDGTVEWLKQQKDLKLILNDENLGFPRGCNQGIQAAEKGNDILLLNNDTIVTPNWLKNLKKCLYSKDDIGAVGSVTNSCSNFQVVPAVYNSLEELIEFASKNNVSNSSLWEERLRLVGFCMLIKNEVVKKIGLLDDRFSPGNFEDDDYSFRIRKAGYRLILCKDSYIHHFGSVSFKKESGVYKQLLTDNRKKFAKKWGFDPCYIANINKGITEQVSKSDRENIRVLHIGCAGGGTLLDIKNTVPSSELFGIEPIKECIANVNHFANIKVGDLSLVKTFEKEYFDFIIYSWPQLKESMVKDLSLIKDYIKESGTIFITPTEMSLNVDKNFIRRLEESIKGYSFRMVAAKGQQILVMEKENDRKSGSVLRLNVYNKESMSKLTDNWLPENGLPGHGAVVKLIRRLDNNIEHGICLAKIGELIQKKQLDYEEVKEAIKKHGIDKIKLFNIIGMLCFNNGVYDKALMFLKESLKLDRENRKTIYNIVFILHHLNQNEAALGFINGIGNIEDDMELARLKQQIEEAL